MKIGNDGKPNYEPRPRGPKPSGGGPDANAVFWVCVAILIICLVAL